MLHEVAGVIPKEVVIMNEQEEWWNFMRILP